MTDIFVNRFFEQLAIKGTDEQGNAISGLRREPFHIENLTLKTIQPAQHSTYEAARRALKLDNCVALEESLPKDGSIVYNQSAEALCIDGTNDEDVLESGCTDGPFYIFNIAQQLNVAGPFEEMASAKAAMLALATA